MQDFVNIVKPYENALFTIPINKKFSFCKLNRLYAYEIGFTYARLCGTYFRCVHLLREYSYSDYDASLLDLQRKDQEKKLREFNKTFNKKRLRNASWQLDVL